MELDDIKKWLDTSADDIHQVNDPVWQHVHQRSRNPLAHLARKMKVGLIFFPLAVTLFATDFIAHPVARLSILKWMLLGILSLEFLGLLLNYQLIKQLLNPCGNIKFNFLTRISRLKKSFKRQFSITAILFTALAVALEIVMYHHRDANFNGWHTTSMPIRISCYAIFLFFQFQLKKYFHRKQFGSYMEELENLVEDLK